MTMCCTASRILLLPLTTHTSHTTHASQTQGTLLDDVGPWSDPDVLHRLEPLLPAAGRALKALRISASSGLGVGGLAEEEDGYASPK